jgi:hypothetical protein
MRNARLYRWMAGLILVALTLGASLQHTTQHVRMEQDPLALTRKHIVDSVEPLCREVLPHDAKLLFLATPTNLTPLRNRRAQLWEVDCLDARGEQRLHLMWNEANNSLVGLYQPNLQRHPLSHPTISKAQALHESGDWMERLAIMPHEDVQQCACTVETLQYTYNIQFRLKEQSVIVCIDAYSDELLFVIVNSVRSRQ